MPLDAGTIINKIAAKYSGCRSYEDSGFTHNVGRKHSDTTFATRFVRPNLFRFDWTEYHPNGIEYGARLSVVWANDDGAFTHYHFAHGQIRKESSLEMAVAGATGVSRGLIHFIYSMLLATPSKSAVFRCTDWQVTEDHLEAKPAYVLAGKQTFRPKDTTQVWVTSEDYVVRKVSEQITISQDIHDSALEFLKTKDPALYEQTKNIKFTEDHFVQETEYTSVAFDGDIDKSVFSPEFPDDSPIKRTEEPK